MKIAFPISFLGIVAFCMVLAFAVNGAQGRTEARHAILVVCPVLERNRQLGAKAARVYAVNCLNIRLYEVPIEQTADGITFSPVPDKHVAYYELLLQK